MDNRARPKIVVVGGGFGGLAAIKALKGVDAEITLIDKRNHHLFQPLLYQVATAALSAPDIAEPIRKLLGRYPSVQVLFGDVADIDTEARILVLADGPRSPTTSWFSRPVHNRSISAGRTGPGFVRA